MLAASRGRRTTHPHLGAWLLNDRRLPSELPLAPRRPLRALTASRQWRAQYCKTLAASKASRLATSSRLLARRRLAMTTARAPTAVPGQPQTESAYRPRISLLRRKAINSAGGDPRHLGPELSAPVVGASRASRAMPVIAGRNRGNSRCWPRTPAWPPKARQSTTQHRENLRRGIDSGGEVPTARPRHDSATS